MNVSPSVCLRLSAGTALYWLEHFPFDRYCLVTSWKVMEKMLSTYIMASYHHSRGEAPQNRFLWFLWLLLPLHELCYSYFRFLLVGIWCRCEANWCNDSLCYRGTWFRSYHWTNGDSISPTCLFILWGLHCFFSSVTIWVFLQVERVSHRDNLRSFVQKSEDLEKKCLMKAIKSYCELRILPYGTYKTVVFWYAQHQKLSHDFFIWTTYKQGHTYHTTLKISDFS